MSLEKITLTSSTATDQIDVARISDDGRYAAYVEREPGSAGENEFVVIKDLQSGERRFLERVAAYNEYDFSADGSLLAYSGQKNGVDFVGLWDRATSSSRTLVNDSDLTTGADIDFSSNGQFIALSKAADRSSPDNALQIDVQSGAQQILAQSVQGEIAQSADGRYVLIGNYGQAYSRLDRSTGAVIPLADASASISDITISGDGRYAVFTSNAALAAGDTNGAPDIYLKDFVTGDVRLISTSSTGEIGKSASTSAVISSDGSRVAFLTASSNLTPFAGDGLNTAAVLKDLGTGILLSVAPAAQTARAFVRSLDISSDGLSVAFVSKSRLTSDDTNSLADAYVDRFTRPTIDITSVSGDNRVNAAEAGSSVTVSGVSNDPNALITVISPSGATTSTRVGSDGSWIVTVGASGVPDGDRAFTATVTDDVAAFLTSTATKIVTFDTTPPTLTGRIGPGSALNAATVHAATISGTSDAIGQFVAVSIDGRLIDYATVQPPAVPGGVGAWSLAYDASGLTEGDHNLDAKVADPAGNLTDVAFTFQIDLTPPKIAITSVAGDDVVTTTEAQNPVAIVGTSDAIGRTVTITAGDRTLGTAVVRSDKSWSANVLLSGPSGPVAVTASVSDPAGNVGTAVETAIVDADIIRVSVGSHGEQGTSVAGPRSGDGFAAESISADGRFVLFASYDTSFNTSSTKYFQHFLKDTQTGALTAIDDGDDGVGQLSKDGRFALYLTGPNSGPQNGDYVLGEVYDVVNLSTGAVTVANTTASGAPDDQGPRSLATPRISADGRYVVFTSSSSNLVDGLPPEPATSGERVYVKDLKTGAVSLASFPETDASPGDAQNSTIGAGRYVAFQSTVSAGSNDAGRRATDTTNSDEDIFVRDIQTGAVKLVSATPSGASGDGASYFPEISADGRYVAFFSYATNLVAGHNYPGPQAYVRDLQAGKTALLSAAQDGTPLGVTVLPDFTFSGDGRYVAFLTPAPAAAGDTNGAPDVYLKDLQTGALRLVSSGGPGAPPDEDFPYNGLGDITPDGRYVTFTSADPNIVPGDTNGMTDAFVRRLVSGDATTLNPIAGDNQIDPNERSAKLPVSGTTTVDGTVTVTIDGATAGTASVNADGTWSTTIDATALTAGRHSFAATARDAIGFSTSAGAIVTVPAAQQQITVSLAHDTGTSATDRITSDPTLTVATLVGGETVGYSLDGTNFTTTQPTVASDGPTTITVRTVAASGAETARTAFSFTLDRRADTDPAATLAVNDTADHLIDRTEARQVTYVVTGLDADASAVATFTDGTRTVTASVGSNGSFAVDLSPLAGRVTSSLAITDIAGNSASVAGNAVQVGPADTRDLFGVTTHDVGSHGGQVYALYEGVLGRAPDALGFENFAAALDRGTTPIAAAQAMLSSPEYTAKHGDVTKLSDDDFVTQLYADALGRAPDASGRANWDKQLASGLSRAEVAFDIATSAEAQNRLGPTFAAGVFVPSQTDGDIARLYYAILNRAPDPGGLGGWETFAQSGASLATITDRFLTSAEGKARVGALDNSAFVNALYESALGREAAPDPGSQGYVNALNAGATRSSVVTSIAESPEAKTHLAPQIELGLKLTA